MRKEDKRICCICLLIAAVILAAVICSGLGKRQDLGKQTEYTVRPGDTLYGIALRHGVEDWRRWCREVSRANGIEGYILRPGDSIIIYLEEN